MVDYFKIKLTKDYDKSNLLESPLLNFFIPVNKKTGEIITVNKNGKKCTPCETAHYKNLTIEIYETGSIYISGSLHIYWNLCNNNGKHNFNDFNIEAVITVFNNLFNEFKINTYQCILKGLEIGLNLTHKYDTYRILESSYLHQTKLLEFKYHSNEGKYKQTEHSQYIIKLYDKALHYRKKRFLIPNEILRFEIKYEKMQKLNELGIYTVKDLLNFGIHNFKPQLLTEWNSILFFDANIDCNTKRLLRLKNPNHWTDLLRNNQRSCFYESKRFLAKETSKLKVSTHQEIANLISSKIDFLKAKTTHIDPLYILSDCVVPNKQLSTQYTRK